MFPTLLKAELERRDISYRKAAAEIGISHTALIEAAKGNSLTLATAVLICNWMNVPVSVASGKPEDEAVALVTKAITEVPGLKKTFEQAAQQIKDGELDIDDFNEIVNYAFYLLDKRRERVKRDVETAIQESDKKGGRRFNG